MRGVAASALRLLRFSSSLGRDNRATRCAGLEDPDSSLLRIVGSGVLDGDWQQPQTLQTRSFASDAGKGSDESATDKEREDKRNDLRRWWQIFSEQSRAQREGARKTDKERARFTSNGEQIGQDQTAASGRENGDSQWLIPDGEKLLGQEQKKALNKETISRWFQPKDTKASSTEQEREEITSKQVGARWLASSQEKASTEPESSKLSSISWLGLSKETPASERERVEVSMQRLALMSKMGDNSQAPSFMFFPPKNHLLRKYYLWDNKASPEKRKINLSKVRRDFQIHQNDCGSSQVQIAQLTTKIKYMTKHMETHRKDFHSRKGLEGMIQRRRKILKYLRRKDWDAYCDVISKLGLRDNVMEIQKR